ncbi:MAG TPA: bifunctional shikimate kinase/3-dehydroquinate synthase [Candidatus Limnocylindrales bacterium]|nr:bifunctional shikimate kinase/3-dehydroquinate synthase [Candidatus Limnocylindrales bacterium]
MDLVLVGLPGSGKSAVGRRVAAHHEAAFVDLDASIEQAAGRPIPEIFAAQGEEAFRGLESIAIEALGPADDAPVLRRVIATGGGAILAPRNRWRLYRGRHAVWLQASVGVLARRVRFGTKRPLLTGPDPRAGLRELAERRARFYAAARRIDGEGPRAGVVARVDQVVAAPPPMGTALLHAETPVGELHIGSADGPDALVERLGRSGSGRTAIVAEPEVWRLHGARFAAALRDAGMETLTFLMPRGEAAKTIAAVEALLRDFAGARLERGESVVALGGGALGDAAGFAAAVWLRGVPLVHVPTTLLAQMDSAIGGKTGVDLPEGKNLVGAFHPPSATIVDVSLLETLPERERRAALGEAVKMALLGDEALFELLEREGAAIARGDPVAFESGALAELVERCAWRKVEIVIADPSETRLDGRIVLNLGHTIGHAVEAASGYRLLHGEAVAHGLRGALAVGGNLGVTPPELARRALDLLDELDLAQDPSAADARLVRSLIAADKKRSSGRVRWVLAGAEGPVIRVDVPELAIEAGIAAALGAADRVPRVAAGWRGDR